LWLDNNRRAFDGERVEGEIEAHVGGGTRHYYNIITPIRDAGEICGILGVNVDITERKRAETALRDSEERFRKIFEDGPLGVTLVDLGARIQHVNRRLCETLGYSEQEIITLGIQGITHPDDWERYRSLGSRLRQGEIPSYTIEKRYLRKDGRVIWGQLTVSLMCDAAGQPTHAIGMIEDITERKRAEEALQKASEGLEQRVRERAAELTQANERLQVEVQQRRQAEENLATFRRFAEAATQGFGMADIEGRIIYANPFLVRLLGAPTAEDLIGKHVSSYYPADYLVRREREILPAVRRSGSWHGEQVMVSADGQTHPTIHSVFPVRDEHGELLCTAAVMTDITELKRVEAALRQSYEELRAIYDGMVDGLIIADAETTHAVRANAAACRMLGYSEEELRRLSVTEAHPAADLPWLLERFQAHVEGRSCRSEDIPFKRKDGTVFYADVTTNHIRYGDRPCMVAFIRDVTERKRAQEMLRKQNELLGRSLLASDHERKVIAYDIHDSFLQQVAGATMQFEAYDQLRTKRKRKAAAEAFGEGMKILRESHLEARRLIRGVRPLALDQSSVVVALRQFVQGFEAKPGPKTEFHSQVDFDRLESREEIAIYRIIHEGVTNARRHSESDTVRVELVQQGDTIRILIQDQGIGFEPSRTGAYCFGLESIRERAKMLGGQADIVTSPGEGTHITVELPVLLRDEDE
jgi:PAS domain S-box-containing protein